MTKSLTATLKTKLTNQPGQLKVKSLLLLSMGAYVSLSTSKWLSGSAI